MTTQSKKPNQAATDEATLPLIRLETCKAVNQALDDTFEISTNADGKIIAARFFLGDGKETQKEEITIPKSGLIALAIEGAKRTLSKDTASSLPKLTKIEERDAAIREIISVWVAGYADLASKRKAEKAAVSGGTASKTAKLPFPRMTLQAEIRASIPKKELNEKVETWLQTIEDASDDAFEVFILAVQAGESKNKYAKAALESLARKAEAERLKAEEKRKAALQSLDVEF
jgi:hypothetical protein